MNPETRNALSSLCRSCGLCCDGTLFTNVTLESNDPRNPLSGAGIPLTEGSQAFSQPCPALCNRSCQIYENRPARCRTFDCKLYEALESGEITPAAALEKVRSTQETVARIHRHLTKLGECNQALPMSVRCRPFLESQAGKTRTEEELDLSAELRLAVHDFTSQARLHFYKTDTTPETR